MRRAVVTAPGRISAEEVPEPARPGPGEVALDLHTVGICGGDVALLAGRNPLVSYPVVPGHECVATVAEDPSGRLAGGTSVVVYPTLACGRCRACADDRPNNCAEMTVLGLSDPRGCLAERFVVPAAHAIPLPGDLGARFGALVEPLAVAEHVADRSGIRPGDTVLVVGAGAIGSAVGLAARARGASRVLFTDTLATRGGTLAALGFTDFAASTGDGPVEWVRDTVGSVDVVFDTVTTSGTAAAATAVLAGGGRYVAVAAAKPGHRIELDYQAFYARELSLVASRNYTPADFTAAIGRLERGEVDPTPLRTAVFGLGAVADAFAELTGRPERNVKVLLTRDELVGSSPLLTSGSPS
ncbi:alcohol dehydrogenase catalytic domain-containing protein [Pseudonocardia tropica]